MRGKWRRFSCDTRYRCAAVGRRAIGPREYHGQRRCLRSEAPACTDAKWRSAHRRKELRGIIGLCRCAFLSVQWPQRDLSTDGDSEA